MKSMFKLVTFRLAVLLFALPWALTGDVLKVLGSMLSLVGDAFTGWFSSMFLGKSLEDLLLISRQAPPSKEMAELAESLKKFEEEQKQLAAMNKDGDHEGEA